MVDILKHVELNLMTTSTLLTMRQVSLISIAAYEILPNNCEEKKLFSEEKLKYNEQLKEMIERELTERNYAFV